MKQITAQFYHRLQWLNLPSAVLIALLQRAPVLRIAAAADELAASSPIGAVLRAAVASLATLGAVDSMAGATAVTSSKPTPLNATVGTAIPDVVFDVTGTAGPASSWKITGTIPPGLNISSLTSPGTLNTANPDLGGTPTTAGSYTITLEADYMGLSAPLFNYDVVVTAAASPPSFTTQPQSQTVTAGQSVTFTAAASGSPTYQWQFNGAAVSGATSASLMLTNVQAANAGTYTVVATNSSGAVTSSGAMLTVNPAAVAPAFTLQPVSQTIASGSTVVFLAQASGSPAPTYQWRLGGAAISGATNAMLVIGNTAAANAGAYTCVATNASGSATSSAATLTVAGGSDIGHLTNLSIRTNAGNGDQTLIVGFVVGGGGAGGEPLLIRATGPALTAFGVTGVLADPVLNVFNQKGTIVATNDNWGGSAQITSVDTKVGAFPLTDANSLDAALYESSQAAGAYTAQVTGNGGGTGIALAEIYDATAGAFTASTPQLTNISARAQVGTGANILIAGFVIGGSTSKTVLIRATGPALTQFGVTGVLADPLLQLFQGSNVIATNDNWGGDAQITAVGNQVGAFALTDPNSKDAVLLITLPPGVYTAQVSGVGGGIGVALVEVYEVP